MCHCRRQATGPMRVGVNAVMPCSTALDCSPARISAMFISCCTILWLLFRFGLWFCRRCVARCWKHRRWMVHHGSDCRVRTRRSQELEYIVLARHVGLVRIANSARSSWTCCAGSCRHDLKVKACRVCKAASTCKGCIPVPLRNVMSWGHIYRHFKTT